MVSSNSKTNKTKRTQIFARNLARNVSTGNHAKRNVKLSQKIASGHVHQFESTFRIFRAPGDLARPEILASEILYPAYYKDTIHQPGDLTRPEILACDTGHNMRTCVSYFVHPKFSSLDPLFSFNWSVP